ncbi:MAG: hypothetical protein WDM89_06175 [Rhizomicrobium sp.]
MSPKLGASTQRSPICISAVTAPSRDEPQPKLRPAIRIGARPKTGSLKAHSGLGEPSGKNRKASNA